MLVDHPLAMGIVQAVGDLVQEVHASVEGNGLIPFDAPTQMLAGHVLFHQVGFSVTGAELQNRDDIGVAQTTGNFRQAEKAGA